MVECLTNYNKKEPEQVEKEMRYNGSAETRYRNVHNIFAITSSMVCIYMYLTIQYQGGCGHIDGPTLFFISNVFLLAILRTIYSFPK